MGRFSSLVCGNGGKARSVGSGVRLALVALLASAGAAMAQGPPTMPAVTFPVDNTSVVTAITAAGAAIILLWFGPSIGFSFVKGLFSKLRRVAH